ncbi:MAG: hypothetical protein ACFWTN_04575 [Clostridium sp.]|jgi:hypothetical protein
MTFLCLYEIANFIVLYPILIAKAASGADVQMSEKPLFWALFVGHPFTLDINVTHST